MILSKPLVHKILKLLGIFFLLSLYVLNFIIFANSCGGKVANMNYLLITNIIVVSLYLSNTKRYKYLLIIYSVAYIGFVIEIAYKLDINAIPDIIMFFIPIIWVFDAIIQIFRKPKTISV